MTLWLDGWSVAALGTNTLQAYFVDSEEPLKVTFSPLTEGQVRAAASGENGPVIAKYLGRLVTPRPDVACSASGCTASGEALDPAVLASLASAPGVLGEMYSGANIRHGLYAARVAVPDAESSLSLYSDSYRYTLMREEPVEEGFTGDGRSAPATWPASAALSYGFGFLFDLDPMWSSKEPQRWEWTGTPYTPDTEAFFSTPFSPLFMYGLADTYPAQVFTYVPDSLLSYLTSPTVACGLAPICVPASVEPVFESFSVDGGERCLANAVVPSGRVALLQQDFVATVDLPYPTIVPGVSVTSDPANESFTSDTLSLVMGEVQFSQRNTFVADELGMYSFATVREVDDPSEAAWDRVLSDELFACPS